MNTSLSIFQKIISYTAWPFIMLSSMYCTSMMIRADIPMMLVLLIIAVTTLLLSMTLELWMPLKDSWKGNKQSIQLDFTHLFLTELAAQGLFRVILFALSFALGITLTKPDGTGLWLYLGIAKLPVFFQFFIGLTILDLGLYWQHRIFHMNYFFWMAHQVHHTPKELSSISAIRNHLIGPLTTVTIILIFGMFGPSFEVFVMVHAWIIVKGWLQHSNANFKTGFFDYLFPTPNIHRWHHSSIREEADCNFGILTNFWDHFPWHRIPLVGKHLRLQRSTFYYPKNEEYPNELGISEYTTENKNSIEIWWMQFTRPFKEIKRMLTQHTKGLGQTNFQKSITLFSWPLLIILMVFSAKTLFNYNVPIGIIAFSITISALVIIYILQRLNPLNKKWKGQGKETQLDLTHILLSEGLSHAIITTLASWIGFSIGFDLWGGSGLQDLPFWIQFTIGLAILDLGLYWQHRILHEVPSLWKAHRIHHAVRSLSPTRAGRHHPISPILTTFIWMTLTGLGLPPNIFIVCQAFAITNGLIQHSNIRIQIGFLEYFFASPTFHRWHHSLDEKENNRNFGPNLSIWDQVPWHRIPVFGKLLRFQYKTFYRGNDDGPNEIGLEETYEVHGKGIFVNWWHQVSEPVKSWLRKSK